MATSLPDYIPGAPGAPARTAVTVVPNTYDDPSITSDQLHQSLFAPQGAVGTVILQGIITQEEYNADLDGARGLVVYDQMWRSDGQAAALLNVLTLPLTSVEKTVEPSSDSPDDVRLAQFASDNLFGGMDHTFASVDEYVTRAWLRDGFALLAKQYVKSDDGRVRLKRLMERPAKTVYRWFPNEEDELDRIQQRVWKLSPDGMMGQYYMPVISADLLVLFTHLREGNNFAGVSAYRPAYKHWYIKTQLEMIQAIQAERMALGVPKFKEPQGPVQKSDRDQAARLGASLHAHQSAFVTLPFGWEFTFETPGAVLDLTPAIEYHSLQMVRSVLAQFLNLDRGGSYALSMDISTFFTQSATGRATYLADEWSRQVIKPLIDINFRGVQRYPKLHYSRIEGRQIDKFMNGLAAVLPWLTKNAETENAVRELLQLPDLPPEALVSGGSDPTVESSGSGKTADPTTQADEVTAGQEQGDAQSAAGAQLARADYPAWVRETVAQLLREPHPGLSDAAYQGIVHAQAAALVRGRAA